MAFMAIDETCLLSQEVLMLISIQLYIYKQYLGPGDRRQVNLHNSVTRMVHMKSSSDLDLGRRPELNLMSFSYAPFCLPRY